MDNTPISHWLGNGISAAAIIGGALGYAPALAAAIGGIWYAIKIYESATVQRWVHARRQRKIARLKARVLMMEAQDRAPLPLPKSLGGAD